MFRPMDVRPHRRRRRRRLTAEGIALVAGLLTVVLPRAVWAHGEAARGSGTGALNTVGATNQKGHHSVGVRYELRHYKRFTDDELRAFALAGEDVHMHSQEMSIFLGASFGITKNWALDVSLPINIFLGFREGVLDGAGAPEIETARIVAGIGDALLSARCRFLHRGAHHLAVFFGIKLPSGNHRQKDDQGSRLGAHNQPGTGSVDFQAGLAYTFAWKRLEVSADLIANLRTEGATQYRLGNSIQADLAISYAVRFWVPIVELNFVWGERDIEDGQVLANSGFRALYLTAGMRFNLGRGHNLWAAFSYPVYQPLPGIQNPEFFRVGAGYGFSFRLGASSPVPKKKHHHHHDHHHR